MHRSWREFIKRFSWCFLLRSLKLINIFDNARKWGVLQLEFHSHIYEYTGMHILCRLDTTSNSLRSNSVLLEKPSRELEVRLVAPPAFYKKNKKTLTDICAMAKNKNKTFSSDKDIVYWSYLPCRGIWERSWYHYTPGKFPKIMIGRLLSQLSLQDTLLT